MIALDGNMGVLYNHVVIAPIAVSKHTLGAMRFALREGARLFLGAPEPKLATLRAEFPRQDHVRCEELSLSSPEQIMAFITRAHRYYRRLDCLMLAEEIWQSEKGSDKYGDTFGAGIRTLLQCLDASLNCAGEDLHIVTVSPERYRKATIQLAGLFIRTKQKSPRITIRMTAISNTGTAEFPNGPAPTTSLLVAAPRTLPITPHLRVSNDELSLPMA